MNASTLKEIEKQSCPSVDAQIVSITLEQIGRQLCQQRKTWNNFTLKLNGVSLMQPLC